ALRISGDSVCSSCRRFMKLTCSAAERVLAAGNSRRNSHGSGSSTKHRGQANSNIVVSHPLAQFMEQGVAGLVAQLDLGAIEVGGQRLQDGPPGVRVAAAQIVETGFAVQAGSSVLAALLEQLLDPDVDLRQPVTVAETRRDRGEQAHMRLHSSATAPPTLTSQPGEQKQQEQQTQGEHPPARRRWPPGYGRRGRRRDELLVQLLDQFRLRVCCINRCWSWSTALRLVSS